MIFMKLVPTGFLEQEKENRIEWSLFIIMKIVFIIVVLIFVSILLLLNLDNSLKTKLNIMIGLLFAIAILMIVNTCMLYPQYKNSLDIQSTMQEINNSLGNWNR